MNNAVYVPKLPHSQVVEIRDISQSLVDCWGNGGFKKEMVLCVDLDVKNYHCNVM